MTTFNYLNATVTELEAKALELGLPIEVTPEQAAEYRYPRSEVLTCQIPTTADRRLVLLGRIAVDDFDKSTTPPQFVVDFAASKGLTMYEKPLRAALDVMQSGLLKYMGSFLTPYTQPLYCQFAGRTLYLTPSVNRADRVYAFVRALEAECVPQILQDGPLYDPSPEANNTYSLRTVQGYHWDKARGVGGFVLDTGEGNWAYLRMICRGSGTLPIPAEGSRHEDFLDLTEVSAWYNLAGGGFHKRALGITLEALGVTLSKEGLYYNEELVMGGEVAKISVDLNHHVSVATLVTLSQSRTDFYTRGYLDSIINIDLPSYLRQHTCANRLLVPEMLYLSSQGVYSGPNKYAEDPVSALVIAYMQEHGRSVLKRHSSKEELKKELFHSIGDAVNRKERAISLQYQLSRCNKMLCEGSNISIEQLLTKKSLVEVAAYLER